MGVSLEVTSQEGYFALTSPEHIRMDAELTAIYEALQIDKWSVLGVNIYAKVEGIVAQNRGISAQDAFLCGFLTSVFNVPDPYNEEHHPERIIESDTAFDMRAIPSDTMVFNHNIFLDHTFECRFLTTADTQGALKYLVLSHFLPESQTYKEIIIPYTEDALQRKTFYSYLSIPLQEDLTQVNTLEGVQVRKVIKARGVSNIDYWKYRLTSTYRKRRAMDVIHASE